jgi:hypothetical protein
MTALILPFDPGHTPSGHARACHSWAPIQMTRFGRSVEKLRQLAAVSSDLCGAAVPRAGRRVGRILAELADEGQKGGA